VPDGHRLYDGALHREPGDDGHGDARPSETRRARGFGAERGAGDGDPVVVAGTDGGRGVGPRSPTGTLYDG
jgi:hypothetical protein